MNKYIILDKSHKKSMKKIKTTNESLNILEYYRHIELYVKMQSGKFYKVERLIQKAPKNMIKGDVFDDWEDPNEDDYVHAIDIGGTINPISDLHMIEFWVKDAFKFLEKE